ncbi:hypothetical protein NUU61_000054 [Penicillium alfredii]|uniref:Uncharacterized protein n=1 Tax=Penicillium alfredii TaxID=1506179 RepID=A0A9W9G8U3_9EURO|nr:uncharacterized protein NUU61_000054 [Penicillium alfredii]KAJ5114295.1 hypothetical protein NUU61_000054 [Penicillium alfredii]
MEDHGGPPGTVSPRRITLEASRSRSAVGGYPRFVTELARAEVKMLTEILHLDNTADIPPPHEQRIRELIQNLPKRLRREWPFPRAWPHPKSTTHLCELHRPLNQFIVADLLLLIQEEITTHFRKFDAAPHLISPIEADILASLRALKGLWTKPQMNHPVAPNAWPFQINGCAACILARITADKNAVRNLRVMLQSRTRTSRRHHPRRLMAFIDEFINCFGVDADELYSTASQLAYGMKDARKACTKVWYEDPKHERKSHRKHDHRASRTSDANQRQDQASDNSHAHKTEGASRPKLTELSKEGIRDMVAKIRVYRPTSTDVLEHPPTPTSGLRRDRRLSSSSSRHRKNSYTSRYTDDDRYRRSRAPSPELRCFTPQSIPERPANPEPPNTIPSPDLKPSGPSPESARNSATKAGLNGQINDVMAMYQRIGKGSPYSSDTFVRQPSSVHQHRMTQDRIRGYHQFVSSPLSPELQECEDPSLKEMEAAEILLEYALSSSGESNSEWTDEECEDWAFEGPVRKDPSPAVTTWSLVCDHGNVI